MIKSIKEFFRSYNSEVLKPSLAWLRKHWRGTGIFTMVAYLIIATMLMAYYMITYELTLKDVLPEKIVNKFSKKKTEN